jgi:hypothetical protein
LPALSTQTSPGVQSLSPTQGYQRAVEPLLDPHVQWPAWQFAPSPHAVPSLTGPASTQRAPSSHWLLPLRHCESVHAAPGVHALQLPASHTESAPQALPQLPQLASSVCVETQRPAHDA